LDESEALVNAFVKVPTLGSRLTTPSTEMTPAGRFSFVRYGNVHELQWERKMIREFASNPWTYVTLAGFFLWLIPLWHSLRSGSLLAVFEVLLLLAVGVALPSLVFVFASSMSDFPVFGALGAIQAIGGSALMWIAALLIALAADIAGEFRRAERRRNYVARQ
jgi:hypothetical protein